MSETIRFKHRLEYYGVRALVGILSRLSMGTGCRAGLFLGDLIRIFDKRHRQRALEQSAEILGLSPKEAKDFVKANFRGYGMAMAEFAQLRRLDHEGIRDQIEFGGYADFVKNLVAEGKGVISITAHYGNWEWCNSILPAIGCEGGSIARPLDNPLVNEFVREIREKNGMRIFDKAGAIRKAVGTLRRKQMLGVLTDQNAGRNGLMSPFLGKPASTLTIPVELAIRTGSPIYTLLLRRGSDTGKHFTVVYDPNPFRPDANADPEKETRRLTDAINASLSALILQAPEQWLWIHRRWKSVGRT